MEKRMISSLDLFRKFCGRYTRIEMGRLGFSGDLGDAGRFYLTPMRGGTTLGHKTRQLGYPYVDVIAAGLDIKPGIRGSSGVDPFRQLQDAYWQGIKDEFLEGRRFFLHVHEPYFPSWRTASFTTQPNVPCRFRTWPAIKKGMVINRQGEAPVGYLHWSAFVPEGTPEYNAIRASLDIAERIQDAPMKPSKEEIERLQETFFAKLELVPA